MTTYELSFDRELAQEMPMVDIVFEILTKVQPPETPFLFTDLMTEVVKIKQLTLDDEQLLKLTAQLYTDINIDGRFASTKNRTWGLKSWQTLKKDEILNLDNDFDEDDIASPYDEEGIADPEGAIREMGEDSLIAGGIDDPAEFKVVNDEYSEDDVDIDSKVDDELPEEIEDIPDEISLDEMRLEEQDDSSDDDPDDDN